MGRFNKKRKYSQFLISCSWLRRSHRRSPSPPRIGHRSSPPFLSHRDTTNPRRCWRRTQTPTGNGESDWRRWPQNRRWSWPNRCTHASNLEAPFFFSKLHNRCLCDDEIGRIRFQRTLVSGRRVIDSFCVDLILILFIFRLFCMEISLAPLWSSFLCSSSMAVSASTSLA